MRPKNLKYEGEKIMKTDTICREMPCCPSTGEWPRYYARQLITSDDLTLEQEYFRSKLRLHNRMLHGWGVVCGALVCLMPKKKGKEGYEPWQVIVKPGYALDPCGNEISIDCARSFDVRTRGVSGVTGEPCVEAKDPWCSEVFEERPDEKLYVAVKYKQFATRPVRVQPIGCGCDDTRCENSRWRDGYEISVLNYCPDSHQQPPDIGDLGHGPIPTCPDCPDDPWVVLASVIMDADGALEIDNWECRRLVFSFKDFWWACDAGPHGAEKPVSEVEKDLLTVSEPESKEAAEAATGEAERKKTPRKSLRGKT